MIYNDINQYDYNSITISTEGECGTKVELFRYSPSTLSMSVRDGVIELFLDRYYLNSYTSIITIETYYDIALYSIILLSHDNYNHEGLDLAKIDGVLYMDHWTPENWTSFIKLPFKVEYYNNRIVLCIYKNDYDKFLNELG